MTDILTRLQRTQRGRDFLVWMLWRLPTYFALGLAGRLVKDAPHDFNEGVCVPCHARSRIKLSTHAQETNSKRIVFCPKCNAVLGTRKWQRYCTNDAPAPMSWEQARQRKQNRFRQLFWQ